MGQNWNRHTYEQNGISHYQQFYINTIPTLALLAAIVACAHAPVLIPLVGLAIASMAQAH